MIVYIDYKGGVTGDPYWGDVILHLNAETSLLHDSSPLNTTMVASGSPTRESSIVKYGSYSINATGGKVTTTNGIYYGLMGANEFTLQTWVYCIALPIGNNNRFSSFDGFILGINSNGSMTNNTVIDGASYATGSAAGTIIVETWHHVALTRTNNGSNSKLELFIDGNLEGTSTYFLDTGIQYGSGFGFIIGYDSSTSVICDDFQLTKNVNRYRGLNSFTPPPELPTA